MEAIHQGFLLCNINANGEAVPGGHAAQKVYVVMTKNELVCYSDNPSAQHYSRVNILASFVLRNCRVLDSPASQNSKSFEVVSQKDNSSLEFACPTNSVKFQWVKHLQVQTCAVALSPGPDAASSRRLVGSEATQQPLMVVSRQSPVQFQSSGNQHQVSRMVASRSIAPKILTPVPYISYNMDVLDHSLGHSTMSASGNLGNTASSHELNHSGRFVPEEMPGWIPNNYGNNKHSSLAMSPSPPRARSSGRGTPTTSTPLPASFRPGDSAGSESRPVVRTPRSASRPHGPPLPPRTANLDILANRASPSRAQSAGPPARVLAPTSSAHAAVQRPVPAAVATAQQTAHRRGDPKSTPQSLRNAPFNAPQPPAPSLRPPMPEYESTDLMAKSLNNMTMAEIKAALMSMPEMVRLGVMQVRTPNSTVGSLQQSMRDDRSPPLHASAGRNNASHNSSLMEHYEPARLRRQNSERYDHFMSDGYPAVGSFYAPEDANGGYGSGVGAEISSAEESSDRGEGTEQEASYGGTSSYLDGTEDAQVYRTTQAPEPPARYEDDPSENERDLGNYENGYEDQRDARDIHEGRGMQDRRHNEHARSTRRVHVQEAAPRDDARARDRSSGIPRRAAPAKQAQWRESEAESSGPDRRVQQERSREVRDTRARSAQRVPTKRDTRNQSNAPDTARASSVDKPDRGRYLEEPQRREATEWSRKQAWEKKVRSEYAGSPLRAVSPSGSTPLKLKYRSFHTSLEKDQEGEGARAQPVRRPVGGTLAAPAVDEAVLAIARNRERAAVQAPTASQPLGRNGSAPKNSAGSAGVNAGKREVLGRPESFFAFKNARAGSSGRQGGAAMPRVDDFGAARNPSPRANQVAPISTEAFIRSNQQMLAAYHGRQAQSPARASPSRTATQGYAAPLRRHQADNVTNVAEWRRLSEWLARIGMQKYVETLQANGITKLSLVELMQPSDMKQIGIATEDIPVILNSVTEFTNRTRSLSEQVLNHLDASPPSSPSNSFGSAPRHTAPRGVHERGAVASAAPARPAPPSRPLFQVPEAGAPPASKGGKPLKAPYSAVMGRGVSIPAPAPASTLASQQYRAAAAAPMRRPSPAFGPPGSQYDTDVAKVGVDEHIFSDLSEIIDELFRCFDSGERELFFHAWKQAALYMPDDCITLNPNRPAMFSARQVIEFHLHLHFAVYPTTHHQGKKAEKLGKLALQRYLESVMMTSELDALNGLLPVPARDASPPAKSADVSMGEDDGARLNTTLNTTLTSFPSPASSRLFTRSREYAVYAGMVLVPQPEHNVAFQSLFQPHWMESLKERLRQFLQLVRPNVEIVPTAAESVVSVPVSKDELAPVPVISTPVAASQDMRSETGSVRSGREKVRHYITAKEPSELVVPATIQPSAVLDDFAIQFNSRVAGSAEESAALNTSTTSAPTDPAAVAPDTPVAAVPAQATEKSPDAVGIEIGGGVLAAESPAEDKQARGREAETGTTVHRISRINSPASPVSSVISQLTDDSPRLSNPLPPVPPPSEPAAPTTGSPSGSKRSKKPFSERGRTGMQSQVNNYNKLLRQGATAAPPAIRAEDEVGVHVSPAADCQDGNGAVADPPAATTEPETAGLAPVEPTAAPPKVSGGARRASTQGSMNPTGQPLNPGFGLRRKSASDTVNANPSLAAQVAKYNKLLLSKTAATAEAVPAAASSTDRIALEDPEESNTSMSAAQAEHMDAVVLEIQGEYDGLGNGARRSSAVGGEGVAVLAE